MRQSDEVVIMNVLFSRESSQCCDNVWSWVPPPDTDLLSQVMDIPARIIFVDLWRASQPYESLAFSQRSTYDLEDVWRKLYRPSA